MRRTLPSLGWMPRSVSCGIGQASRNADATRSTNRRQPISMGRRLSQAKAKRLLARFS